jgi:16S rRNA (cytosine1402-N4)-methyltransferase
MTAADSAADASFDRATDDRATEPPDPATNPWGHQSVLCAESIAALAPQPGGIYLDATLGAGGHSAALLAACPEAQLVGLDCDERALAIAHDRLAVWGDRVTLIRSNFASFDPGGRRFNGILADLGVSSMQFDQPDRGFSFRQDGPLDMRMDDRLEQSAADLVNTWDEVDLANAIYQYGEERLSRRIARAIVEQRQHQPFSRTLELAEAIARCVPSQYRHGRIHPATRTFQALRIVVNQELDVLETLLDLAPDWLAPEGRLAIISFHSLEDRIVKHRLKDSPLLQVLTKKPIIPTEAETATNPRARSAKLRVAQRRPPEPTPTRDRLNRERRSG